MLKHHLINNQHKDKYLYAHSMYLTLHSQNTYKN